MVSKTDNPNGLIGTTAAAGHLTLPPQTLRRWACTGKGPLQPVRVSVGRLRWRMADINRLLGLEG